MTAVAPTLMRVGRMLCTAAISAGLLACAAQFRVMRHAPEAGFPGARGDAAHFEANKADWSRTEALGIRSSATVIMLDPSLGADYLAYQASQAGREVSDRFDMGVWQGLYGEKSDRLPFDVTWRFDKMFQPQRVTDPKVGWTFTLRDDHGRSWSPLFLGEVQQGFDADAWTGQFRIWFPTKDVLKGPLFDGRTGAVTLHIEGAPGSADATWKFRPETGEPAVD